MRKEHVVPVKTVKLTAVLGMGNHFFELRLNVGLLNGGVVVTLQERPLNV